MKKKRFYNNKKRNQKWTEPPAGREIDFADKYADGGSISDEVNLKRAKAEKKKARRQLTLKRTLITILCFVLISVGYTAMDVHMTRQAEPAEHIGELESEVTGAMSEVNIDLSSYKVDSVSLDSSLMLSSVINDAVDNGFTSITFDAKRADGTIGYASALASVDTFGAISSPASQPSGSVKELLANDILPVARISCYLDNVAPSQATDAAIMKNGKVYADSDGNTYLNPDSESAYNYIKDIITECYGYGITVFVLYGCDLPEDIASEYNDGFDTLAKKLNTDLDGAVKLLEEVDVKLDAKDSETGKTTNSALKKQIKSFTKIDNNQVYYITTKLDEGKALNQLNKNDVTRYIVEN